MTPLYWLLAVICGIFTWSFLEYVIHRWLGHSLLLKTDFGREHRAHHRDADYFAATLKKVLTALPILLVAFTASALIFGWQIGLAYTIGFGGFYTFYEVVHRRIHTHAPFEPYGRFIRKHHLYHHFHSARSNHGVTSHIWDVVFGTRAKANVVRVPEGKTMRWLCDEDGQIKPPFRRDYELLRQRRNR